MHSAAGISSGSRHCGNMEERIDVLMCKYHTKGKFRKMPYVQRSSSAGKGLGSGGYGNPSKAPITGSWRKLQSIAGLPRLARREPYHRYPAKGTSCQNFRNRSRGSFPSPECGMNSCNISHPPSSELPAHLAASTSPSTNHTSAAYQYRRWF
jgi:hypothetical protein